MARSSGRSGAEVERIVREFERGGLKRREYCERIGIALPTLDWYRRRMLAGRDAPNLVPVRIEKAQDAATGRAGDGFTLVLTSGHRIEAGWSFDEMALSRLIRIAGAS